ncbi:MAG: hypothetical protein AMXMBFR19_23450 [Chthonomonadaceae bacterium]|uniref:Uncharacterized protein n=1 Tax=Candidatus Nitrosymbiomonas proteolyticus TaxID=2608984 RepID=A0A809S9V4_9BACT|nr:conserved hypothetical protein [Candidatus Nitrosymbiomonas proteolyticus]
MYSEQGVSHSSQTNGTVSRLSGAPGVLQAAKNKARGYSNPQKLIAMSYLLHGKLRPATHTK